MARSSNSPITYLLRDPKAKKPTPVNCVNRFLNERINVGTGFKVLPTHWNGAEQRVKNVVDALDKDDTNSLLDDLESAVRGIVSELRAERLLTKEAVRKQIDIYLAPAEVAAISQQPSLFSFIEDFIKRAPNRINLDTGKPVEYRTFQRYQTALNGLRAFTATFSQNNYYLLATFKLDSVIS